MSNIETNLAQVIAEWEAKIAAIENSRSQMMAELGQRLLSWARADFVSKGRKGTGADGSAWKDDKPETIERRIRRLETYKRLKTTKSKEKKYEKALGSYEIGRDTARLLNSLKYNDADSYFQVQKNQVVVGSQVPYAEWFDKDRPIFPASMITEARQKELEAIVEKYLVDPIKK